jgi:hypothetical protein
MKENESFDSYASKSFCTSKNYTKDLTQWPDNIHLTKPNWGCIIYANKSGASHG